MLVHEKVKNGPARPAVAPSLESALDVLERFGLTLQRCDQTRDQIRHTLDAVRDGLGADAVFWHPGSAAEPFEVVGTTLTAEWASDFIGRVTGGSLDRLVRNFLDPAARPMTPWPYAVALARLSRSGDGWLGALSFHPRRLFQDSDLKVLMLARRMLLSHRHQGHLHEQLRDSLFGLVRCLTAAIDAKDPHTWGHSERVGRIACGLGRQMGLPPAFVNDLYLAGLLHDVGKIGIRDSVLQKPGKLTDEEYEHIKEHPVIGDRLVGTVRPLAHLRPGVRHHHERWDGKGYPDRLAGEAIPLQARILAVADSCDAMMAARPYRPGLPPERIDAILIEGAGTQWDPDVIAQFMTCREELYAICQGTAGDPEFSAVEHALALGREKACPS